MDLLDYDRKIRDLLADTDMYERLSRDPTLAQERKMNSLLLTLMRSGTIPEPLYQCLRSSAGQVPCLYRLPKVHKAGALLRIIVSFIGSPTYCLSRHLVTVLSPLVGKSDSHIRNSADFPPSLQANPFSRDGPDVIQCCLPVH